MKVSAVGTAELLLACAPWVLWALPFLPILKVGGLLWLVIDAWFHSPFIVLGQPFARQTEIGELPTLAARIGASVSYPLMFALARFAVRRIRQKNRIT